jgi:hypothetical protein
MPRCLHFAATIIVFATSGSVLALAQNAQAAENAKTDVHTWGPEANGLALSIGVDKKTYVVGQSIPLHIAFRNARASEGMTLAYVRRWHSQFETKRVRSLIRLMTTTDPAVILDLAAARW